jgi:hypothetical protein
MSLAVSIGAALAAVLAPCAWMAVVDLPFGPWFMPFVAVAAAVSVCCVLGTAIALVRR